MQQHSPWSTDEGSIAKVAQDTLQWLCSALQFIHSHPYVLNAAKALLIL